MNEERLNEIANALVGGRPKNDKLMILYDFAIETEEMFDLIAAARERNELEIDNNTLKQAQKINRSDIGTLRANNAALREAGEALATQAEHVFVGGGIAGTDISGAVKELRPYIEEWGIVHASTPADSLTEYRNEVLEKAITDDDILYIKRCAENLREFMQLFEDGPTLSTEILADNTNYLDCWIDKIERLRAIRTGQ